MFNYELITHLFIWFGF